MTSDLARVLALAGKACANVEDEAAIAAVKDQVTLPRQVASYVATALAGSGDNGDRYAARQICDLLGEGEWEKRRAELAEMDGDDTGSGDAKPLTQAELDLLPSIACKCGRRIYIGDPPREQEQT